MVSRFETITKLVGKKYKDTSLLAFFKMDDNLDAWTLLYSSPKVNDSESGKEYRRQLFSELAEILRDSEAGDESSRINRMGVFDMSNHIIEDALNYKSGTHIVDPTRMNGNIISEGYISISKG